ncbi:MAG: Mu-like prophage major head subunit gpT family protein [Deltaproteobacteria bacterium]|nr:Mu-like prophage major head subunit gpT family protein [Deltaproteobacteria bacterium]
MIINAQNLANLYVGFNTAFNAAFQAAEVWHPRVAMQVPANTRIMDFKFMLNFPMVREWLGDRQIQSLPVEAYQVAVKDWESTIEVDRNDIEDDTLGLYTPIVTALAEEARKHPDYLVAQLLKNGFATSCWDGQYFFDTDHPVGAGTASNYGGGAGTAWYLLDTSRAIKPLVHLLRKTIELTRMDRADDEHVFMRKKFRYGVDARYEAAYGLWQLAYASKDTLNTTNYAAARAAMMSLTNAEGRPLGIKPNLLVVPPTLEATAREILQAQFIIGDPTAGGSKTNVWQGTADLLVMPELA